MREVLLQWNDIHAQGFEDEFYGSVDLQLFQDVLPVGVDGMRTQVQFVGDLLGRQPFGYVANDLDFPLAQCFGTGRFIFFVLFSTNKSNTRLQKNF